MNPTVLAYQVSALARDILSLLTEYPRELLIDSQLHPGRIDIRIRPNINDQGRVVGRDGAHIKALKSLLARIGQRHNTQVVVFLEEDEKGRRIPDPLRPPSGLVASPVVPVRVLCAILNAITIQVAVVRLDRASARLAGAVVWQAEVQPACHADHDELLEVGPDGMTPMEAIATLYKAVGRRNGVEIKIEVAK